jgi:2-iminobutanoate/2-iminopropanoate deaminase
MTIFDNPAGVPAPPPGRYSHVASIDLAGTRLLLLSGQVAVDADRKLTGTDMATQTEAIFDQVATILAAHGATFEHVVSIRTYLTDMDQLAQYGEARRRYLNSGALPTSTTVEVSRLFIDGALLEVEVTAVVLSVRRSSHTTGTSLPTPSRTRLPARAGRRSAPPPLPSQGWPRAQNARSARPS